jgi:hypothetical protein
VLCGFSWRSALSFKRDRQVCRGLPAFIVLMMMVYVPLCCGVRALRCGLCGLRRRGRPHERRRFEVSIAGCRGVQGLRCTSARAEEKGQLGSSWGRRSACAAASAHAEPV